MFVSKNHGGIDRALFTFDLSADLRPAFHWNIHQLFVFVVAEYKSDENVKKKTSFRTIYYALILFLVVLRLSTR